MKVRKKLQEFCRRAAETCATIFLAMAVASCFGGVPSESDARDVFVSKYEEKIDQGLVQIDSFSKVNAQQGEKFGVKFYKVEYQATISWPEGLNTHCVGNIAYMIPECWLLVTDSRNVRNVGQVESLNGELTFEKTEKGWKGQNGKVY